MVQYIAGGASYRRTVNMSEVVFETWATFNNTNLSFITLFAEDLLLYILHSLLLVVLWDPLLTAMATPQTGTPYDIVFYTIFLRLISLMLNQCDWDHKASKRLFASRELVIEAFQCSLLVPSFGLSCLVETIINDLMFSFFFCVWIIVTSFITISSAKTEEGTIEKGAIHGNGDTLAAFACSSWEQSFKLLSTYSRWVGLAFKHIRVSTSSLGVSSYLFLKRKKGDQEFKKLSIAGAETRMTNVPSPATFL